MSKEELLKQEKSKKLGLQSNGYMLIFYTIVGLIIFSMTIQFVMLNRLIADNTTIDIGGVIKVVVNTSDVLKINHLIPYETLLIAIISYMAASFGLEGGRGIIKNLDFSVKKEVAETMPLFKRRRLVQMLITFIILAIIGMVFQLYLASKVDTDFQLETIFAGIAITLPIFAACDMGPKLANEISKNKFNDKNNNGIPDEEEDIK
jgi:hypothetical protein